MRLNAILLTIILIASFATARTIHVPGDRETIQEAINITGRGDIVLIHPGTYYENLLIERRIITVASLYLTTGEVEYIDSTVIDGDSSGSVITVRDIETEETVICGLTIQKGYADNGGGMLLINSSPSITRCVIRENQAYRSGGGLCCLEGSFPVITHSVFDLNETNIGGGGGIFIDESGPILQHCIISRNHCDVEGGGGIHSNDGIAGLVSCTIAENRSDGEGGAVFCRGEAMADVVNCIFWGNTLWEICLFDNNDIHILYSDVDGGRDSIVAYQDSEARWGAGNINDDPQFLDPENGDFRLTEGSPCIDTGHPNYPPDPDHTRVDMGALFYNQAAMMVVEPEELQFEPFTGTVDTLSVSITSIGENPLRITTRQAMTLYPQSTRAFYVLDGEEELVLGPDSSSLTHITFDPHRSGDYEGVLRILSNDIDYPEKFIPLYGISLNVKDNETEPPDRFELLSVNPNPFNSFTTVRFHLPKRDNVSLKLFNVYGREISELISGYFHSGVHEVTLDAEDLASGIYFIRLIGDRDVRTAKLVLVR